MVIETENLTKYYGNKIGCANVTISAGRGQVFGLLGPNGAGKSTFIKMMTGLLYPTDGTAYILGEPVGSLEAKRKTGYLPENFKYQEWMTGADLLSFHAALYKMNRTEAALRINEVLDLVKMKGQEKFKVGTYSKGMQQRMGLACALLNNPQLLFLDEPTSALDPIGRKDVREVIGKLKEQGKTVLLNSHLLSEVEMVCDSAAIINKGSIIVQGPMERILAGKLTLEIHADDIGEGTMNKLRELDSKLSVLNGRIKMLIKNREDVAHIARLIVEGGGRLYELTPRGENLESAFISLVESEEK